MYVDIGALKYNQSFYVFFSPPILILFELAPRDFQCYFDTYASDNSTVFFSKCHTSCIHDQKARTCI